MSKMNTKRIMIMAGGTGGHVFPALAVGLQLQQQGWEVTWLGTHKGLEARVVPANALEIDWLSITGLRGKGIVGKFKSIFLLSRACMQAWQHLRKRKPHVVLGMGGFVAAPGGLMARLLGIPLVIHEQNRVVGTTNKLLSIFASRVLQAFPESFPAAKHALTVGNPLRADFVVLGSQIKPEKSANNLKVLIVGGSQGAQILNQIVPTAMASLENVQVRHQTGAAMLSAVQKNYLDLKLDAEAVAFIEDMAAAYAWADLVICRSGAMTVSEVAAAGLAAIFVPLPQAIDDHQTANARYLTDAGAGVLLKQADLTVETLVASIIKLRPKLADMGLIASQQASLEATVEVAKVCISEAKS